MVAQHHPATEAPEPHPYTEGVRLQRGKDGRTYRLCSACGSIRNHRAHKGFAPPIHRRLTPDELHPFRLGGRRPDKRGHLLPVCAECDQPMQSLRHRAPERLGAPEPAPSANHGYPVSSPNRHPYQPSGRGRADSRGRVRPLCATCDQPQNSPRHRVGPKADPGARPATLPPVAEAEAPGPTRRTSRAEPAAPAARAGRAIKTPPAEMAMLAIAIDQVLALPHESVSWQLRVRLVAARSAIKVPVFPTLQPGEVAGDGKPPEPVDIAAMPAVGVRHQAPVSAAASIIPGIRSDRVRALVRRAADGGWDIDKTGSGHLRLTKADKVVIVSMTGTNRGGHWWANVRQEAKRAGINVAGL